MGLLGGAGRPPVRGGLPDQPEAVCAACGAGRFFGGWEPGRLFRVGVCRPGEGGAWIGRLVLGVCGRPPFCKLRAARRAPTPAPPRPAPPPRAPQILSHVGPARQTLLFSATMPAALAEFARAGLKEPELVRLDADTKISPDLALAFFTVR